MHQNIDYAQLYRKLPVVSTLTEQTPPQETSEIAAGVVAAGLIRFSSAGVGIPKFVASGIVCVDI